MRPSPASTPTTRRASRSSSALAFERWLGRRSRAQIRPVAHSVVVSSHPQSRLTGIVARGRPAPFSRRFSVSFCSRSGAWHTTHSSAIRIRIAPSPTRRSRCSNNAASDAGSRRATSRRGSTGARRSSRRSSARRSWCSFCRRTRTTRSRSSVRSSERSIAEFRSFRSASRTCRCPRRSSFSSARRIGSTHSRRRSRNIFSISRTRCSSSSSAAEAPAALAGSRVRLTRSASEARNGDSGAR